MGIDMSQIITDEIATSTGHAALVRKTYENLLVEGGYYVFDGNRVTAHFKVARNGVGHWRLETVDLSLSLLITRDLRIREYRRNPRTCDVSIIRAFKNVFDTLKRLKRPCLTVLNTVTLGVRINFDSESRLPTCGGGAWSAA
jgi:hypothetical protein